MKTAAMLLQDFHDAHLLPVVLFRFPFVHLVIVDDAFAQFDDDRDLREKHVADGIGWSVRDLEECLRRSNFLLVLLTRDEFGRDYASPRNESRGHAWLRELVDERTRMLGLSTEQTHTGVGGPPVVHFYGYKGGQARSSCLAFLACTLALDGWRVLVVDADLEASSLDLQFGRRVTRLDGTLLGLSVGVDIKPERVFASLLGCVDLIACRPTASQFDIEASAFAMRSAIDPTSFSALAQATMQLAADRQYTALFVDHRAGLSPYVLPWVHRLPGPLVAFVRLDEQWIAADHHLRLLLRANPEQPAAFVCFKPDDERLQPYLDRNSPQIENLLEMLAESKSEGSPGSDYYPIDPDDVRDHVVVWPYDQLFRSHRIPDPDRASPALRDAATELRRLVSLKHPRSLPVPEIKSPRVLHPSGARDEGEFIQTQALRTLHAANNSIHYVFGRKGTGKTRLLRELVKRGQGEPLVVDASESSNLGLKSEFPEFQRAIDVLGDAAGTSLWWLLLRCFLRAGAGTAALLKELSTSLNGSLSLDEIIRDVIVEAGRHSERRTLLFDGLETAFEPNRMLAFVEGLFRVLRTVQIDPRLSDVIDFKLFLRSDLAAVGIQNIEQQTYGQTIQLRWDTQTIFNFVLSRISQRQFYRDKFPDAVDRIDEAKQEILFGKFPISDCDDILLQIFPGRLPQHNINTLTFLRTYFTDTAAPEVGTRGTTETDRGTFYPRVYDRFLEVVAAPEEPIKRSFNLVNGRIDPNLVYLAHESAADYFLGQVTQELVNLLRFNPKKDLNQQALTRLLTAFDGCSTPFRPDELAHTLAERANLQASDVRDAMDRMKSIGMFEDRPKYAGQWRVGRLFRSSLRMRYSRTSGDE